MRALAVLTDDAFTGLVVNKAVQLITSDLLNRHQSRQI